MNMQGEYTIPTSLNPEIFRAYDIRGIVGEGISLEVIYALGRAIGTVAKSQGQHQVVLGRDGRLSSPILINPLRQGLLESGLTILDIGEVPTPVVYFGSFFLNTHTGVMLTASHNPKDYNGVKVVVQDRSLSPEAIQQLYQRILSRDFAQGVGTLRTLDVSEQYIARIKSDVVLARPLKIVVDCGNGAAGKIAPKLYRALGCQVIELFCEIDGNFPNHHPDPTIPSNLNDLIRTVRQHNADLGLAFDGDADRLGVVDNTGEIIWPDRQMMLYAIDVLSRNPEARILFDVKCSRYLEQVIRTHGGEAIMWKTGHSLMKRHLQDTDALLGGEMSGHVFFKERWYGFDDGMYVGARLLEILSRQKESAHDIFATLPAGVSTPELKLAILEKNKFNFVDTFIKTAEFPEAKLITIDGLRTEFNDGWGLIRASNTSAYLILRFEADNPESLKRIQELFRTQLLKADPELKLPF